MSQHVIVFPVLVQVLLTFAVLIAMGRARRSSIRERRAAPDDVALSGDKVWNDEARKVSNNYKNQFELPVLFYAVCAFALIMRMVDIWLLVLAWLFVVSRIVHAGIHVGPNKVRWRGAAFLVGAVVLMAMWLTIGLRALTAGA